MFIFRYKRRRDTPESSSTQSNKTQDTHKNHKRDAHNDENMGKYSQPREIKKNMDKYSQPREIKTAGRDDDIKRNVRTKNITSVQEEACNAMVMVDNPIYSSSTDKHDDILIVDNELYDSGFKNNDFPVMVDNDIYVETT